MTNYARLIGISMILAFIAGVLSVSPAVDSANYLTDAAQQHAQVMLAALAQFTMAVFYIVAAVLLFTVIKSTHQIAALNFLAFKMSAATLVIFSTVLLISVYVISAEFLQAMPAEDTAFTAIGAVLKITRDQLNHVFMIWLLCIGNLFLFGVFLKTKLVPIWLSAIGIFGAILSSVASGLVLFGIYDIITPEYLAMNAPTAIADLALSVLLIVKGFNYSATPS